MQYATSALDEPGNYFSAHNAVKCEPVFQTIRYSGFCLAALDSLFPKLQDNRKPGFGAKSGTESLGLEVVVIHPPSG